MRVSLGEAACIVAIGVAMVELSGSGRSQPSIGPVQYLVERAEQASSETGRLAASRSDRRLDPRR
jgi:hypothetical protein